MSDQLVLMDEDTHKVGEHDRAAAGTNADYTTAKSYVHLNFHSFYIISYEQRTRTIPRRSKTMDASVNMSVPAAEGDKTRLRTAGITR